LYGKEGEGETVQQGGRGEGGGEKGTQGEREDPEEGRQHDKRPLLTLVRRYEKAKGRKKIYKM
jgi:hypothetical protein